MTTGATSSNFQIFKLGSLVPYPFLPAKMGGQKGIALFNEFLSKEVALTCITIKANEEASHQYPVAYPLHGLLSNGAIRYANPLYIFKVGLFLEKQGIKHLIIEHPYYGWLGTLLKWLYGIKLIVHSHNIEYRRFKTMKKSWWKLLYYYERWTHRRADYSFFIHEEDRQSAIREFGVKPEKCRTITYGIEWSAPPSVAERSAAREQLLKQYHLSPDTHLFLFNGSLHYAPNQAALDLLINEINPRLSKQPGLSYRILVCGNNLPERYNGLKDIPNMIYAGFVDDISLYFKGASIFLNPVEDGGGIKTKLVEALGYNCHAVSTPNGAIGVDPSICNTKLAIVTDWDEFVQATRHLTQSDASIGDAYFQHFYWRHIAKNAAAAIKSLS